MRLILLTCAMTLMGCAHGPCKALGSLFGCHCTIKPKQPEFQDMRIRLPVFDSTLETDANVDGYVLQAIRIAADDLLPPEEPELPCIYQKTSYGYKAVRLGDLVFVRISFKPQSCGGGIGMLDGGATYAISLDGKILRRAVDGTEPSYDLSGIPSSERGDPESNSAAAPEGG